MGRGFICRLPGAPAPSWLLFALLLICLLVGGVCAGRYAGRGVRGGVYAGLVAGALNLLILGSLLGGESPNQINAAALLWLPASLVVSIGVAALGAAAGSRAPRRAGPPNWPAVFACVTLAATLLLLAVGGSVTGYDHGLAVVDWPNTAGYNMFLYPLARMTGGIYYEHAHRLLGSLVGLTTLVLAIYIQLAERRRWLKTLAWVTFALVVTQGILGGLRVTGHPTLSTDPADTAPNIGLAVFHGVLGQVFLGCLVAVFVALTRAWRDGRASIAAPGAGADRVLSRVLIVLLLLQLVLGALVRHLSWAVQILPHGLDATPEALMQRGTWALHGHITLAVVVVVGAIAVGVRSWGLYPQSAVLRRLGVSLMVLIGLQIALGLAALFASGDDSPERLPMAIDVLLTTAHQTVGAVLLAISVWLTLLQGRLLTVSGAPNR